MTGSRRCTPSRAASTARSPASARSAHLIGLTELTALLMFAAAGEFLSGLAEATVLFRAETGANLWPADADGWLSVLSVGGDGARFVAARDLTAVVEGLRPAESWSNGWGRRRRSGTGTPVRTS
ncbi:hypothetical protein ACVDFE_21935 [Lentzea chajnantorensis]